MNRSGISIGQAQRHLRILGIWIVGISISGCAGLPSVGPDYARLDLPLPAEWPNVLPQVNDAPNIAAWWTQLGDEDLDWLIQAAISGDLDIKLAKARLRKARANRAQAISAYYPTISASVQAMPTNYGAPSSERPDTTTFDAGFDALWELDIFGGTRRSVEASTADVDSSRASALNVRVTLVAEVAQNYVDVRSYQGRLIIARSNLKSQSDTLDIAQWRYQAGLARSTDVEQARASLEQTRAEIPDLEVELSRAKNRLAVLTGKIPGALDRRLSVVRDLPTIPEQIAIGIPASVLTQRPDLIVAERNLAAETARVGQKIAQRYPSLSLGGSFGWTAYSLSAMGAADSFISTIIGTLALTLFDGGRLRSIVEAQNAVQEQALITYEQTVLIALEEVENALIAHAYAHDKVTAWAASAEAARNAAELSRDLYQSGLTDFQQVLISERSRLTAEDSLAQARASRVVTLVKLYKALGGGWQVTAIPGNQSRIEPEKRRPT